MRQMQLRRLRGLVVAASLPFLHACYEYQPIETTAPAGQVVELEITDPGRVGLAPRFGPGLDRITGRLVAQQASELTLTVLSVRHINGESTQWAGESVKVDRGFVGTVKGRKLSTGRTVAATVAAGAVVALIAGKALIGGGKDPRDPADPVDPPAMTRIPLGIRIRIP
jgi:hypothetical protein